MRIVVRKLGERRLVGISIRIVVEKGVLPFCIVMISFRILMGVRSLIRNRNRKVGMGKVRRVWRKMGMKMIRIRNRLSRVQFNRKMRLKRLKSVLFKITSLQYRVSSL